ncbi:MAG: AI-2E family transporter [Clostridia bacterium]|nr:AI-2E family transporter [Clostridia bacterium]
MKLNWNKKYTTIAAYCLIVLIIVVFIVFFFMNYGDFSSYLSDIVSAVRPIIYGAIFAYLMWPVLKLFEDKVFAFVTGNDKIPEVPKKPVIPKVPKEPKKPVKPNLPPDMSAEKRTAKLKLYSEALEIYREEMREYKKALAEKKRAERTCARIDRNMPHIEHVIVRKSIRHAKINERKYPDGAKRTRFGVRRALSTAAAAIIAAIFITAFGYLIVPQLSDGYNEVVGKMPTYIENVTKWLNGLTERADFIGEIASNVLEAIQTSLPKIYEYLQNLIPTLASTLKNVVITVKDLFIGIFFSIYFLLGKERIIAKFRKMLRAILSDRAYVRVSKIGHDLNKNFGSFISAKILDCFIIGLLSLVILLVFGVPYYPLISVVIGITNFVPIFGPIVGGVIGGVIVFISDPSKLLIFIIFDVAIQQFDGNILGPKLLGARTNTTSLGILTALTILSSFWGLTGLLIAVPLFAVIYTFIKEKSEKRLENRSLAVNTAEYYDPDDYVGRALREEAQIRKEHKTTLRQSLSNSRAGNVTLKFKIVSDFVEKVDKTDEMRQAELSESETAFEEAFGLDESSSETAAAEEPTPDVDAAVEEKPSDAEGSDAEDTQTNE